MIQTEGRKEMLYSDPSNPYESIYIRASVTGGRLTIDDDECEHGPDGGWSYKSLKFDKENTRKLLAILSAGNRDPFQVLKGMVGYQQRTRLIEDKCQEWDIVFTKTRSLSW